MACSACHCAAPQDPTPQTRSNLLAVLRVVVGTVLIVGVIARLNGDRTPGLATIYYAMPLQVLAALTTTMAVLNWGQKRRVIRWGVCTAVLLAGIAIEDYRIEPDHSEPDDLKIVFWNACRMLRGWGEVTAEVRRWDADVIALVEAGSGTHTNRMRWQQSCPGYKVSLLGAGIVLLTRGESGEATVHEFPDGSRARQIRTRVRDQDLLLVVTDIQANPLWSRKEPLARLTSVVSPLADEPTLVLGDFNTPIDSELFEPLRSRYVSAFDAAGRGYRPTWPQPLPVLAIDQAWVSPRLEVTSCRNLWTSASDHRPVLLTVRPHTTAVADSVNNRRASMTKRPHLAADAR